MKTNKEKLLKLLKKAVENGWEALSWNCYAVYYDEDLDKVIIDQSQFYSVSEKSLLLHCKGNEFSSLNDLIANWEEGKISFIEAIAFGMKYQPDENDPFDRTEPYQIPSYFFREMWVSLPTSQRLEWLFETFKHLL